MRVSGNGTFCGKITILLKDDHVIVLRPCYAINIQTPRAIGCKMLYIFLKFEKQFQLDVEEIKIGYKAQFISILIIGSTNLIYTLVGASDLPMSRKWQRA
jgi:aspartate/methionine/tyrosine aminotransferase